MYIAIDVILVAITLAVIIGGIRRGFIRSVFKLCSTIAAVIVAVLFYKELSAYFYDAFFFEITSEYIGGLIGNIIGDISESLDVSAIAAALPEQIRSTAELLGLNIEEIITNSITSESLVSADALTEGIAQSVATVVSNVTAFAALFFGSLIVLGLLGFILDKIAKLPVLKTANRFLGFVFGVAEAFVLGMIVAKIISAIFSAYGALNPEFTFTAVAENTYIAKFLLDVCPW
nr:CvpA family protein [Clostridia bacterium]